MRELRFRIIRETISQDMNHYEEEESRSLTREELQRFNFSAMDGRKYLVPNSPEDNSVQETILKVRKILSEI
jgi:hypothetical protein